MKAASDLNGNGSGRDTGKMPVAHLRMTGKMPVAHLRMTGRMPVAHYARGRFLAALLAFCLAGPVAAEPGQVATRDRMDGTKIAHLRANHDPYAGNGGMTRSDKPAAAPVDEAAAMLARSVFLSDNTHSVLIPAGAVLHVPEALAGSVSTASAKPLLPWSEFFQRNRFWLKELPLDSEQVTASKAFDERLAKSLAATGGLVVSTFTHQPVAPVASVKDTFAKALKTP